MTLGILWGLIPAFSEEDPSGMGWELSLRYTLAKEQCASLYGVASLGIFSLEGDGRDSPLLLPGIGLGANADIIHVEVKFHKWPGA